MKECSVTKIKLIDLFSGAGGLSNGFEQTGRFEVIGAVEINKDATDTYISNHGNNPKIIIKPKNSEISDITKIDFREFLNEKGIDGSSCVVIGGPPCQGFSNANRQKNYLISGNNQLVKEFVRAIDEIRPKALLMENVKMINSEKHKFFVTEVVEGTKFYSSLSHLEKISKKPFWKKDNLVLMDTKNVDLEFLITQLISKEHVEPYIKSEIHLSRMRSILRNLKKGKTFKVSKPKEKLEIENIISKLRSYNPDIMEISDLINEVCSVLELILKNDNEDNEHCLEVLLRFEDVNQLLRYINEIKDEGIYCLGSHKAYRDGNRLLVGVPVLSYSIVEYLKIFFENLGYDVASDILLASDFCTPQTRSRYMILGVHRDSKINENLLVKMPNKIESVKLPFTVLDAIGDLEGIKPVTELSDNPLKYVPSRRTKMQEYFRTGMKNEVIYNHINTASRPLSKERFVELQETGGKNFHSLSLDLKEISYTDISRTQNTIYLRLSYNEPSPTVVNVRKSMWQHPNKPQALSIREAARLQSFKDNFIFKGTKDKQYQQIGNAVPPLLARAVAEQMLSFLGKKPIKKIESEFNFNSEILHDVE